MAQTRECTRCGHYYVDLLQHRNKECAAEAHKTRQLTPDDVELMSLKKPKDEPQPSFWHSLHTLWSDPIQWSIGDKHSESLQMIRNLWSLLAHDALLDDPYHGVSKVSIGLSLNSLQHYCDQHPTALAPDVQESYVPSKAIVRDKAIILQAICWAQFVFTTENWRESAEGPCHSIALDHSYETIVVSLQGSSTQEHLMHCLMGQTVPFLGGLTHEGILKCAHGFYYSLIQHWVAELIQEYPTYDIVLTGHSLGAGIAILLTLILFAQREVGGCALPPATDVRCFAFAPPPIFSPLDAISEAAKKAITCYVHKDDVVPRLCYGTAYEILKRLTNISSKVEESTISRMFTQLWERGRPSEKKTIPITPEMLTLGLHDERLHLKIPGKIYRLAGTPSGEEALDVSNPTWFYECHPDDKWLGMVRPSSTCWRNHMEYPQALVAALETIRAYSKQEKKAKAHKPEQKCST